MANDIQILSEQIFGLTKAFEAFTKNSESRNAYEEFAYGQGVSKYDDRLTTSFPKVDAKILNPAIGTVPIFKTDINAKEVCFSFNYGGENATLIYESDFSSGADGWSALNGTVDGNIDGINGQDNCLRFYGTVTSGYHTLRRIGTIPTLGAYSYFMTGQMFIPDTNTNIQKAFGGAFGYTGGISGGTVLFNPAIWLKFGFDFKGSNPSTNSGFTFGRGSDSVPATFACAGIVTNDLAYFKDIKIYRKALLNNSLFNQYLFVQTGFHQREIETNLVGKNIKHLKGYLLPVNLDGYNFPINAPFLSIVNIGIDSNGFVTSQNQSYYENSPNLYSAQFNGF